MSSNEEMETFVRAVRFVKPKREEVLDAAKEEEEWEKKSREEERERMEERESRDARKREEERASEVSRERPEEAHAREVEEADARFEALRRNGRG